MRDNVRLTKTEAVTIIHNCAVLYHKNLLGKNVLFVTSSGGKKSLFFETVFLARNFLHFTGVETERRATDFFNAALENKLGEADIRIVPDGTTRLKLEVLSTLMNIHKVARMVGDYNHSKSLLVADKLAGTQAAAMGFVEGNGYFIPNTVLNEDIRGLMIKPQQRVIAIFVKKRHQKTYTELTYIAKGFTLDDELILKTVNGKVDFKNVTASFEIPRKQVDSLETVLR